MWGTYQGTYLVRRTFLPVWEVRDKSLPHYFLSREIIYFSRDPNPMTGYYFQLGSANRKNNIVRACVLLRRQSQISWLGWMSYYLVTNRMQGGFGRRNTDHRVGAPLSRWPKHLPYVKTFWHSDLPSNAVRALCHGVPMEGQFVVLRTQKHVKKHEQTSKTGPPIPKTQLVKKS